MADGSVNGFGAPAPGAPASTPSPSTGRLGLVNSAVAAAVALVAAATCGGAPGGTRPSAAAATAGIACRCTPPDGVDWRGAPAAKATSRGPAAESEPMTDTLGNGAHGLLSTSIGGQAVASAGQLAKRGPTDCGGGRGGGVGGRGNPQRVVRWGEPRMPSNGVFQERLPLR